MENLKPCDLYDSPCWCRLMEIANPDCADAICKDAREAYDYEKDRDAALDSIGWFG